MIQRRKVGIVGTGHVGVAAAYALFIQGIASELVLVDVNQQRAEGEAMDLMHGQTLVGSIYVHAGSYADLKDAQVVVLAAGVGQKSPDETRLELLNRNAAIFRDIIRELDTYAPGAILIPGSRFTIIFSKVVFPHPFGPTKATLAPLVMTNSAS